MRYVSDKSCRENQNTHFVFNNFFENRAPYGIILENTVQRGRPQITIWRPHITFWIPKATNIQSEYVTIIASTKNNGYKKTSQCYVIRTLSVFVAVLSQNLISTFNSPLYEEISIGMVKIRCLREMAILIMVLD
jgi:hypothetical protein